MLNFKSIKTKFLLKLFTGSAIIVIYYSCATTGSPSGGPRDTTPPKLDTIKSDRNFRTNFTPQELNFYFDEFIDVRDAIRQVLISPPTTYIPKVTHRGKKLYFRFDEKEILRENVTYTINFGEAVVDFREGNKFDNFTYVFSTGDVIDSLTLSGKVLDALSGKPDEGILVFLYDQLYDSIVVREKPFYFSKTDKDGQFKFENIKSDTFSIFALKDENLNYLYDLPNEKIAFADFPVILNDSSDYFIELRSSVTTLTPKIVSTNKRIFGKLNILYNTTPAEIDYKTIPEDLISYKEVKADSLNIYYDTSLEEIYFIIQSDSIQVNPKGRTEFISTATLKNISSNFSPALRNSDSLFIEFNHPISFFDPDGIKISDSIGILGNINVTLSENQKKLIFNSAWQEGTSYNLTIDSASISDIYGLVNDSLALRFSFLRPDQLASIQLTINGMDSAAQYVVRILQGTTLLRSFSLNSTTEYNEKISNLIADKYIFEIIEDSNKNGVWDSGDYWNKKQPEKIKIVETERLRANWDTDVLISWSEKETIELKETDNRLNEEKK